jgi:hypothetical protein
MINMVATYDTGKASRNDGQASKMSRLKCSVFSGTTFAVIPVSNHHPSNALLLVVTSGSGNGIPFTSRNILHLVGFAIGGIDGADQHVVGDVVQVTTILEPRASHYRNVSISI